MRPAAPHFSWPKGPHLLITLTVRAECDPASGKQIETPPALVVNRCFQVNDADTQRWEFLGQLAWRAARPKTVDLRGAENPTSI
jgi:hypothetical protein